MSLIRVAIPAVLVLVGVELVYGMIRRRRIHDLADSITDFGCAAMSQVVGLGVTAVTVGAYSATESALAPFRHEIVPTPLAWVTVFLVVDLGQYLLHRLSHRVNVLWACHAVHHSSEEFNYTVGLRNSSFHGFLLWVFFLPAAVVGVPWRMLAVCYGLNVLYQFWLHTRLIGRLGPLEAVLNTPSHHRVHHGADAPHLDQNFAGVLIVWDRLFGTFVPETTEPRYGVVSPLGSWNPVWANVQGFALIRDAWKDAPDWKGRWNALFGPPESLAHLAPVEARPAPPRAVAFYTAVHLALALALVLGVVLAAGAPSMRRVLAGAFVLVTLGVLGGLLDGRRWAIRAEWLRLGAIAGSAALLPVGVDARVALGLLGMGSVLWLHQSRALQSRTARLLAD